MSIRVLFHRLIGIIQKRKLNQDLDEEIQSHLDMQIEDNIRRGMTPEEATYAAKRSFGGVEQIKETYRDRKDYQLSKQLSRTCDSLFACSDARRPIRLCWC